MHDIAPVFESDVLWKNIKNTNSWMALDIVPVFLRLSLHLLSSSYSLSESTWFSNMWVTRLNLAPVWSLYFRPIFYYLFTSFEILQVYDNLRISIWMENPSNSVWNKAPNDTRSSNSWMVYLSCSLISRLNLLV